MLYCSSVLLLLSLFDPNKYLLLLLRQTTFNSLHCICWVRLCCLIAQNIFVHSRIHCSCYTLLVLDVVTQTDVVGQVYVALTQLPDFIYDLDQPRTTYDLVTEAPIATTVTSSRHCRRFVRYLIVHLTPG